MIIYGIKTCDTCRKARKALEAAGHAPEFRDVRETPLSEAERAEFIAAFGDALLNRSSTTWRGLDEAARAQPAEALLAAHPTLMKRPVIRGETLTLGWKADAQAAHDIGQATRHETCLRACALPEQEQKGGMFENATQPALTGSPIDRSDHLRADTAALDAMWADPAMRVTVLSQGNPLLREDGSLVWLTAEDAFATSGERMFLGVDAGAPRFAVTMGAAEAPEGMAFAELRGALFNTGLAGADAAIAAGAKALANWHHTHTFCARCGGPSEMSNAGWRRDCPACGAQHFPRTDPVVIMLIVKGDRCVIARNVNFPDRLYSCIAGFVEPGESIEEAVRRETLEELGLRAGRVAYVASQPWPFPASLMFGCIAETEDEALTLEAAEIADARWLTRDDIRTIFDGNHPDIAPPRRSAIARSLLEDWMEGRIDL